MHRLGEEEEEEEAPSMWLASIVRIGLGDTLDRRRIVGSLARRWPPLRVTDRTVLRGKPAKAFVGAHARTSKSKLGLYVEDS